MVEMSVREMLEAGAHFGHQTSHWNPRMKPYIFGARNGIHIIDLQKTLQLCQQACQFLSQTVSDGGNILFVGTKKQAQAIVQEEAVRAQMFFVNRRWLGGTLTNFRTIKGSIDRLKDLEKKLAEGGLEGFTKKEKRNIEKEVEDLTKNLGGIKEMAKPPQALFLIDAQREDIALSEALRLGIPVVALADTNCSPEGIDYLIPANDDAIKSIRLFTKKVADACLEGLARRDATLREKVSEGKQGVSQEKVVGGEKGQAYVSAPESYEKEVEGAFKSNSVEEKI